MTIGIVIPSSTKTVIAWARDNAQIIAQVAGRVSATRPVDIVFPFITATRITGVAQLSEVSIDFARIQFNVWGGTKNNGLPDWDKADEPCRVLEAEIRAFRGEYIAVEAAYISEMSPYEGMQQLEDPDTRDARYWMDALVVVRRADGQ